MEEEGDQGIYDGDETKKNLLLLVTNLTLLSCLGYVSNPYGLT